LHAWSAETADRFSPSWRRASAIIAAAGGGGISNVGIIDPVGCWRPFRASGVAACAFPAMVSLDYKTQASALLYEEPLAATEC
jgi:hypothetical protein